jgi:hypothetical protein
MMRAYTKILLPTCVMFAIAYSGVRGSRFKMFGGK